MSEHPEEERLNKSHAAITKATRARQQISVFEISLVAAAAILIIVSTAHSAWNVSELQSVSKNLTQVVATLEANQEEQQRYNEEHAESAGKNFSALIENSRCLTDFFVEFNRAVGAGEPPPDKATLDSCFLPATPAPPPAELPSEHKPGARK